MIDSRLIVCIASDWDYDPTSKHHLMRILSRNNKIVWVNYRGSRRPELSRVDLAAGFAALQRVTQGVQRITESMVQLTPFVIPGARNPALRFIHERLLVAQIRRAVDVLDPSHALPVQVWSFAPDVPFLVRRFGEECFVYYCVDEHSEFEGFDRERTLGAERQLLQRADFVVTTSAALQESKRALRDDAVLIPHGVDFDHFAAAWRNAPPPPSDVHKLPRPVLGYFGLIHHWVDIDWLCRVAQLRPAYSFVMIGDCKIDVSAAARLPNVHFLGRKPHAALPAYCAAFDAGLMLFKRNVMTRCVNPIKMYEYLAAGLPVVTTPLPEAQRFEGPVRIAESPDAFAIACDEAVTGDNPSRRAEISRCVESETWSSKVEQLSELIRTRSVSASLPISKSAEDVLPPATPPAAVVGEQVVANH